MPDLHFNTPALEKIVSKYNWATRTGAFNREDLLQVGREAVERAKLQFDPSREKAFASFAWLVVSQAVGEYANEQRLPVRVPRNTQYHCRVKGRIAPRVSVTSTTVINRDGDAEHDLLDVLGVTTDDRTAEQLDAHLASIRVHKCIAIVRETKPRLAAVLQQVFVEERSQKGLADEWRVTRQRVGQMYPLALAAFARAWAAAGWERP